MSDQPFNFPIREEDVPGVHKFVITVRSSGSRRAAEMALLSAFSARQPDACEFEIGEAPQRTTDKFTTAADWLNSLDRPIVGEWISVAKDMPDDDITVLVWDNDIEDATLAYHDTAVLERRKDSGWIVAGPPSAGSRVLLNVTHWCKDIEKPPRNVE